MNKSYRVIFNRSLGIFQIVSELAKSDGKLKQKSETCSLYSSVQNYKSIKRKVAITLSLPILLLSNAYATCTGALGGSYLANAITDICTLADGTYTGTTAIRAINGATINNAGDINVIVSPSASARGVITDSNSTMNLNNVTVTMTGASTGQFYGIQANNGTIIVNGNYSYTASGLGLMGIGAGSPTSQGVLTIQGDANIIINAGSSGTSYGVFAGMTGSLLTLEKNLTVTSAGTGSSGNTLITAYGGFFDRGSTTYLNGDSNIFTLTGVNAIGLRILTGATLNSIQHLEVKSNSTGGRGILVEGGMVNLGGINTIEAYNYGININAAGNLNATGKTTITTMTGSAVSVSGINSVATFNNPDSNSTQITINGTNSSALNAITGGRINFTNGIINSINSNNSNGTISAIGENSKITMNNIELNAKGGGTNVINKAGYGTNAGLAEIEIRNSKLTTGDSTETGLSGKTVIEARIGGMVNVVDSFITTYRRGGYGIFAFGSVSGAPVNTPRRAEINVSGTMITTYGDLSRGVESNRQDASQTLINLINSNVITYGSNAHGLAATISGEISFSNGVITTAGSGAFGAYAQSQGTSIDSKIAITDSTISNIGRSAHGIYIESGSVTLEGNNIINTSGSTSNGIVQNSSASILTANLSTSNDILVINATGINSYGLIITGTANLYGVAEINTTSTSIVVAGSGQFTAMGKNTVTSNFGHGIEVSGVNAKGTFNNATANSTQISALSDNMNAVNIVNGGTVNLNNTNLTTSGRAAHSVVINGPSILNLTSVNSISTTGEDSHGISLQNGAIKTFDGQANNVLPTIKVTGFNSALLHATGNTSALALVNQTLDMSSTPNADTFGVKAENLGLITLDSTNSGGTGLWATNGNIIAKNTSDLSGSRVKLDNGGTLDISTMTISDVAIGSLESNDALSKITGGNKNLIIGQNNTTNNGSLIDNADFKGKFENVNQLIKKGNTAQILSGLGNTVGSVEVQNGTLRFTQDDGIVNQGTPFNVTGDYTTKVGATTAIGDNNSTLMIGGAFIQEASAIATKSTLEILLGASPDIQAKTAHLAGILNFTGFSASLNPTKASTIIAGARYEMIRTMDGITGSFAELDGVDYLISQGFTSANNKSYLLGFGLAWTEGGNADGTGSFTMIEGSALDVDIALNNESGTFASGWNGQDLTKNGEGELILSAQNGYTGSTTINGGTLYLAGAGDISTSSNLALTGNTSRLSLSFLNANETQVKNLSGVIGSHVNVADKDLIVQNTIDTVFAGDFDVASGGLIKEGEYQLTLSGKTQYTGDTKINEGKLVLDGINGGAQLTSNVIGQTGTLLSLKNGATLTGWIDPTDVNIDTLSRWNMTADSIVNTLNHTGTLNFTTPNDNSFKTLRIEGDYIGNDGLLIMNTQLGDDASATDRVVVLGNTAGTTRVQINNVGGTGAKTLEGIELIEVQGLSAGEFKQTGRIVAGAYDYMLARGEGSHASNWYLTSQLAQVDPNVPINPPIFPFIPAPKPESVLRPEGASYVANLAAANTVFKMNLADRTGASQTVTHNNEGGHSHAFWLRSVGGQSRFNDQSDQLNSKSTHYTLQIGRDLANWNTDQAGQITLGVMAGYAHNQSQERSQVTAYRAKGSVSGYSVGVYGTWYANAQDQTGAYVDTWAQYNWFNNRVKGDQIQQERYRAQGLSASLEAGYRFKVASGDSLNYFIQPQAQAIWLGVNAGDHRESNGTRITNQKGNQLETRVGLKLSAQTQTQTQNELAKDTALNMFIEANWIHHSNALGIRMDDVSVKQGGARNVGEMKLGIESKLNQQLNIWGNLSHQRGSKGFKDTSLNLGLKYQF